jgi:hypothetical protein
MKRGLVEVKADAAEVLELSASKRLRVQPEAPGDVAAGTTGLLDLPDLVLFELCHWSLPFTFYLLFL